MTEVGMRKYGENSTESGPPKNPLFGWGHASTSQGEMPLETVEDLLWDGVGIMWDNLKGSEPEQLGFYWGEGGIENSSIVHDFLARVSGRLEWYIEQEVGRRFEDYIDRLDAPHEDDGP